jgi:uncharacterized membrane protein
MKAERPVLGVTVVLLVTLGVAAAVNRGIFRTDAVKRAEPIRQRAIELFHLHDPLAAERPAELDRFDRPFAVHPGMTLLHVLPGGAFLTLALLQFSSRVRNRHIQLHRWTGRALLVTACAVASSALYFGLLMPYGGPAESVPIALFSALFLLALSRAFLAIRRHQVARHREWMIRAFAIALAISTVRVVAGAFDFLLTPAGVHPGPIFVLSIWTGWIVTVAAAELWIRRTRTDLRGAPAAIHPVTS